MRKLLIFLVVAVFMVASSVPAFADADWDFFGNVMFRTIAYDHSKETLQGGAQTGLYDDWDLEWGRHADVAFGASVKAGDIGGFLMIRPVETNLHDGDFSQFYGTWDFKKGVFAVGKMMTPLYWFPSKQVFLDNQGLVGFGGLFPYFKPALQVSMSESWGEFKFALIEPQTTIAVYPKGGVPNFQTTTSNPWTNDSTDINFPQRIPLGSSYRESFRVSATGGAVPAAPGNTDADMGMPKVEASYEKDFGQFGFKVMGGYQQFKEVDTLTDNDFDYKSWVVGFGWKSNFGPFYFNGTVMTGQNTSAYQLEWQQGDANPRFNTDDNSVIDSSTWGFNAAAGWTFSDMLGVEIGYGQVQHEMDDTIVGLNETDKTSVYYINATINVAKGFTITPEIGKADWHDRLDGTDEGTTLYYGARWQITF